MTPDPPRLVPAKRGYSVLYAGKALLSTIDPAAAATRLVASLAKDERTLYLCASPLLGFGLQSLLDTMHPTSALLCLEVEPPLADFTRKHLPPEITHHPRFALLTGPDTSPAPALATLNTWGARTFRRIIRFNLSAIAHDPRYLTIEETLCREIAREWENAATLMKLGRNYALNFLRNLRLLDILPSISPIAVGGGNRLPSLPLAPASHSGRVFRYPLCKGSASELPATPPSPVQTASCSAREEHTAIHVLGAGPSLDRFFAEYHGGIIVCVDTALPALRARGLRADLAVALEAQHWNLRDFVGCRDTATALAMDLSALPATTDCIDGKTYLFFTAWTPLRIFDRLRSVLPLEMPPLGNVGITAYALARRLFSSRDGPIIPHGLDFSFTIDQYHCRGSPGHIDSLRKLDRFHSPFPAAALRPAAFAVKNEHGEPVRQDPVMRGYKELFLAVQHKTTHNKTIPAEASLPHGHRKTALAFTREIHAELIRIRHILCGTEKASEEDLRVLINNNDFLFAHYPDYASTNNGANIEDMSFLKRIRAELDAFIKAVSPR
jgi:hypothetical protein